MAQSEKNKNQERFKRWHLAPTDYEFASDEVQHCMNCGHEFTGNYCPYCSQKAGEGFIGWRSVRQSFFDIWGLGTSSLPRTILHLFLRPGHLIGDYISGKRQVSFPPVKMLFFVAVIIVFLDFYLMPLLLGSTFDLYGGGLNVYKGFVNWNKTHFAWTHFIFALLGILPTWVLFRYAPRHTRHTLPQSFFIQVFMCVINMVLSFIILMPLLLINFWVYFFVGWAILIIYYVIAYRQLFGYGIWGTLLRVLLVFGFIISVSEALMMINFDVDSGQLPANTSNPENDQWVDVCILMGQGLAVLGIGWIINLISRKRSRK